MADKSNPPSPSMGPPDADDDAAGAAEAQPAPAESASDKKRDLLVFYAKKYYRVPAECVVVDAGKPVAVPDGLAAGRLHECKSHPQWISEGVHTRHIMKFKVTMNGVTRTSFYVTFRIDGEDSNDPIVARALHKTIAKKFYDMWQKDWSDEKKEKFAELLADEPSDESQINPLQANWTMVADPGGVLYQRPPPKKKAEEEAAAPPPKKKSSKKPVEEPPDADDDDDQSSAAQSSTALVGMPRAHGAHGMGMAATGAANFFMQTPGMVTISEEYLQRLIANQRS